MLLKALDHIVDLDIGHTQVTDSVFEVIQQLKNLTVLKLNRTAITGNGIKKLSPLQYLKQINLVHSNFKVDYLENLYSFPALEKVYLFGTHRKHLMSKIPSQFHSIFEKEIINWKRKLMEPFEFCNLEKKPTLNVNQ